MCTDGVLVQRTPQIPIGWFGNQRGDTSPYTIIGAIDWADVTVAADILLPKSKTGAIHCGFNLLLCNITVRHSSCLQHESLL